MMVGVSLTIPIPLGHGSVTVCLERALPLYGSSELIFPPVPEKASSFFRTAPTGFQVSPVGHGGTTSLIVLQKVSALGSDLRGKKLAISLEPGWLLNPLGGPRTKQIFR
jgi:D-alanine transfer protein